MKKVKLNVLLFLYNGILMFSAIAYILFLLVTFKKAQLVKFLKTNFGFRKKNINQLNSSSYIWIHTSSVGESMLMFPLVEEIVNLYPQYKILVTSCTKSSKELWKKEFKNSVYHFYLPWDIKYLVKRFINSFKIKLAIFVEAEFWPNYLFELKNAKIPVLLFNARMSDKSYRRWKKFRYIIKEMLTVFSFIGAESQKSYHHIKEFINNNNIELLGSLKFLDNKINHLESIYVEEIKKGLENKWIVLALSTHYPEENMLAKVYIELKKNIPNLLFIISPRHIERSKTIQNTLKELKLTTQTFTSNPKISSNTEVFIVDVFGKTDLICSLANIVYVGKSMFSKARGGHNILQPMKKGKPIIFGQYMDNFKDLSILALNNKAALEVKSSQELLQALVDLYQNPIKLNIMGERAKDVATQGTNIKQKYLSIINNYLT